MVSLTNPPAPAPRYLGPAHFVGGSGNKPIDRIVIHATVSPCVTGGAANVAAYFRTKAAGGSAHYVVDPGEAVQVVWDDVTAYHAPPNQHSLGVELCDPMTGSGHRWLDASHKAMLERAATLVAGLCAAYDVPIRRLTVGDLKAGRHGICGHVEVSGAFHQSTHYDPGPDFPWPQFLGMVVAAGHPAIRPTPAAAPNPPTLWLHGPKRPHWTKVAQVHLGMHPITGVFDKDTRRAVVAYRKAHRLHPWTGPAGGVIGARMWAKLLTK